MASENVIEEIISGSKEKKNTDPKSFSQWIIKHKKYFLFLFSIFPIVITTLWHFIKNKDFPNLKLEQADVYMLICISAIIQCIFLLFAIFLPIKEKRFLIKSGKRKYFKNTKDISEIEKNEKIANTALMQFKNAWTFLWTSWFLLYVTLFIKYLAKYLSLKSEYYSIFFKFLSSFPGFLSSLPDFLSSLPDFLSSLPEFLSNSLTLSSSSSSLSLFSLLNFISSFCEKVYLYNMLQFFLNLFNNCSTLAFVLCYIIFSKITVHNENKSGNLTCWTVVGLVFVIVAGIFDYLFHSPIIAVGNSICAGIAMALFIGRLNNKFINPSIFIIVCLYTYMAIQTLFPFWEYSDEVKKNYRDYIVLLSTNLAFIFKIVFYLFLLWLFRSGKLLFCFVRVRNLIYTEEKNWKNFESSVPSANPPPIIIQHLK